MIIKVSSHKRAAVQYHFDNSNVVSIVWGGGSYSDNHDKMSEVHESLSNFDGSPPIGRDDPVESRNVEIMVLDGHPDFEKWFIDNYDANPASYVSAEYIPLILAHADSRKYIDKKGDSNGS